MPSTLKLLRLLFKIAFAAFFIVGGVNHFRDPQFYLEMMPHWIPWHLMLVYLTGVLEIALGALLLIPSLARTAAWGLIALLVVIFPANIHMALHAELFPEFSPVVLWIRLPFQGLLIAIAYAYTIDPERRKPRFRHRRKHSRAFSETSA
ncbi:MAG: conserved rane protein of unknown function [Fibrobacteria bacterium]|jgi:uncharacterized membrane protein|nr:conserved rane protein of unknown function [Fibrobacteria bacterium]